HPVCARRTRWPPPRCPSRARRFHRATSNRADARAAIGRRLTRSSATWLSREGSMPLRKLHRSGETFSLNLTPLLDVVLQLITFFMMLIHFGTKLEGATKEIRLPIAPAALPGSDLSLDRMVVVIDRDGRLV